MIGALWLRETQPPAVRRRLGLPAHPGPQSWVDGLAAALARAGGVALVVASPGPARYAPFEEDGVRYHWLPGPPARSRAARVVDGWRHAVPAEPTLGAARELARALRPDLIHVHGTETVLSGLVLSPLEAPCVVSLQGLLYRCREAYFAGCSPRDVVRLAATRESVSGRGELHGYGRLRALARREVEVLRTGRYFIGRTAWDKASLVALNPAATYFHCDEIMRPEFYAAGWRPDGHTGAHLYSTSSSMLFKGTEVLLEAVGVLRRSGVPGVRLRVAGVPAGSDVGALYRRVARRLAVDDAVEWLGRLDAAGIAAELEAADVFAYPSHVDNSPNALVEAMLAGVPAVASCAGGIPSLLQDGAEGLLVPRGDPQAFAAAVRRLLDDREEAARLGSAARRRALERNDPARVAATTLDIYRAVLAGGPGTRQSGGSQ